MATTVYSVRIDEALKAQLEDKARQIRTPLQQLVKWILEDAAQKPAADLLPVPEPRNDQE